MPSLRAFATFLAALLSASMAVPALAAPPAVARAVEPFEAVALRAPFELVLRQGAKPALEVQADPAAQTLVETAVVDGSSGRTLEIRLREGAQLPWRAKVTVTVDATTLRAITLSGSGDIRGAGLRTERLDVAVSGSGDLSLQDLQATALALRIAGSGDATLSGRVARFTASVAGSGDIDAQALDASEVTVRIAGSGDVRVGAPASLDVSVVGSGDVSYRGQPKIAQRIAGSGSVTAR